MALATFFYEDTTQTIDLTARKRFVRRLFDFPENFSAATPAGYYEMVDSAFPIANPPVTDITLIYIGGDARHAWTTAEVNGAIQRTPLLWPCWVRSNPGQVNAANDANACVSTLHAYGVPKGVNCILDLETAVNTAYVNTFNSVLSNAGYQTCKYGSSGFIWQNPKTSGGTFVASPGAGSPITIGDAVATQYKFAGTYDQSWVSHSVNLWEAGDMAVTDADAAKIADAVAKYVVDAVSGATIKGTLKRTDANWPTALAALTALQNAAGQTVDPAAVASAVVSQLAAQGLSADTIAQHVLDGLPADMAADVVTAMGQKLAA